MKINSQLFLVIMTWSIDLDCLSSLSMFIISSMSSFL